MEAGVFVGEGAALGIGGMQDRVRSAAAMGDRIEIHVHDAPGMDMQALADLVDNLRMLKDRSWHDTTVGAVVKSITAQNKLQTKVDKTIAQRKIKHADQTQESDASFVGRLGKQYDCTATIKTGCLLFSQKRNARMPSGKDLPAVRITRMDGDSHRYSRSDRDAYSGVRAFYNNTKKGTRKAVVAGISGCAKTLRATFASEADARAEWLRL